MAVVINKDLALEELLRVAGGETVELGPDARSRIVASQSVVEDAIAGPDPIYGLNTGVGHRKDVRLSDEEMRTQQKILVMSHVGGLGPPLSTEIVRAAMTTRVNGLARGGAGVSLAAADTLVAMLNASVHPIVPSTGSVGAGDLSQMASIAMVAIGKGKAELNGEVLDGREALRRVGIEPLALGPKDGLGLMSANGISIGHAALVLSEMFRAADTADVSAGLSLEATQGNLSTVLPIVGRAKPYRGQVEAARHIHEVLEGSYLFEEGAPRSVQDPLSFRVAPQVHGALREVMTFAQRSIEMELNSISDNPLVSVEDRAMVHNGNFHPIVMAVAFDALRVALAHVGQLMERRLSHLWDAFFENLSTLGQPPSDGAKPAEAAPATTPPKLHGLSLRYPAAVAFSELKLLAAPATLDSPPLDIGSEDHATGAPLSVRKAEESVLLLEDLIACEFLLARDVLATGGPPRKLGQSTGRVFRTVEETIAAAPPGVSSGEIHASLRSKVFGNSVLGPR